MKRYIKPLIFVIICVLLWCASHYYGLYDYFMNSLPKLRTMTENNLLKAMTIYIIVTAGGCVILALPGAVFALIAGLLFEPLTGTILCTVSATLGAVLAFLAGRYFLRDSVRPMLEKSKILKRFLFDDIERSGVVLLMVTRLVPLFPYNLQNFAYGLTDIKLLPYTIYTFIFIAPGSAMFTLGTAGLGDEERRGLYVFMALILAVIVTISGIYLKKKFIRR